MEETTLENESNTDLRESRELRENNRPNLAPATRLSWGNPTQPQNDKNGRNDKNESDDSDSDAESMAEDDESVGRSSDEDVAPTRRKSNNQEDEEEEVGHFDFR